MGIPVVGFDYIRHTFSPFNSIESIPNLAQHKTTQIQLFKMGCIDKQSCKIISIVTSICLTLTGLSFAWTIFGPCSADVMLMLDDSGSVSNQNFGKVKEFVRTLANDEQIKDQMDRENVYIGMATFSECPKWMSQEDCSSTQYSQKYVHNSYSLNKILSDYTRMESITDMIKALEFVDKQMMRHARESSDKILLFMADGNSQGKNNQPQSVATIAELADSLKNKGVEIFVIAVGDETNQRELEAISSSTCKNTGTDTGRVCKNSEKYIIKVDNFDGLDGIIEDLAGQVCNHQYWMAGIPILVLILFIIVKIALDRREANSLKRDADELNKFTPGMTGSRV